MSLLRSRPLPVRRFSAYSELTALGSPTVYYFRGEETRSQAIDGWIHQSDGSEFVLVSAADDFTLTLSSSAGSKDLRSRDQPGQRRYWESVREGPVVLDITGLGHSAWAVLLRGAMSAGRDVLVTYAEPKEYTRSDAPTEGQIFDLSERTGGIRPIPGFASLAENSGRRVCVPLLGFEGTRFLHLISVLQPAAERVIPVIGVPGFRAEYPFHSYRGNRIALLEADAWKDCRFAAANCPFSALYALQDIQVSLDPSLSIAVAPIGTKPHALGAMLFYLTSDTPVELVYDHPVRSRKRTSGATTVSVYDLTGVKLASRA